MEFDFNRVVANAVNRRTSKMSAKRYIKMKFVPMIVIGINVALWFEGWFQDVENAEIEERYLTDLRDDLLTNIKNLDFVIKFGEAKWWSVCFSYILAILRSFASAKFSVSICNPIGKPSLSSPAGIDIPGTPARLAAIV